MKNSDVCKPFHWKGYEPIKEKVISSIQGKKSLMIQVSKDFRVSVGDRLEDEEFHEYVVTSMIGVVSFDGDKRLEITLQGEDMNHAGEYVRVKKQDLL